MSQDYRPTSAFFESRHFPYYIASPNFLQKSSGPRMLHGLCHMLNEMGYEAYITSEVCSPWLRTPKLTKEVQARHRATGRLPIAVYPEVVTGNPLQSTVVARWILNQAGHLGGEVEFHPDELLFYWDEWVLNGERNADHLFLPSVDTRLFNAYGVNPEDREGFCYYAHKYFTTGEKLADRIATGGISLCQDIPRTTEEIVAILRRSKVLYCYEPSNIITEAYVCGCPTILVDTPYLRRFGNLARHEITTIPEADIDFSYIPDHPTNPDQLRINVETDGIAMRQSLENFVRKTQLAALTHAEYRQTPAYRFEESVKAFENNDQESAISGFASLLDTLPENPLPSAYLAFICANQGLIEEANNFIERALEIAPSRMDLKAGLGESLLKAGHPAQASDFLKEAITAQPDLLAAYPALAQCLHLTGKTDDAIALLQAVVNMPEAASSHTSSVLLELLAQQGNLDAFADLCLRHSQGLADDLLAARCLSRIDGDGERLLEALGAAQSRLPASPGNYQGNRSANGYCRIAFLLSDFTRESRHGRLAALLQHLPAERFVTQLIINDPAVANNDFANTCSLLADDLIIIDQQSDAAALDQLKRLAPDILIDLDSYGAADRLALLTQADVPCKLLWGEVPLPPLTPDCLPLRGALMADDEVLPGVALPGLGECLDLPDLPIGDACTKPGTAPHPRHFACLTPAIRIGRTGWQLFAAVMAANHESTLTINLDDLGECAQKYIVSLFAPAGIDSARLRFVSIRSVEALCHAWQEADIGLAPPVDDGDIALACCLWMGKPYIALSSPLPWSRRPTALLDCAGAGDWIAETYEAFVERSRSPLPPPDARFRENLAAAGLNDPQAFARGFAATIEQLIQPAPQPA
ncbi:MAG: hypothetical protein D3M94_14800 [Rhodocyclales bacterium GT-UBC]|nr:MAG: hypothetical protein D3M94_14800 [Rhodocyclales bacterium GT-UBC]